MKRLRSSDDLDSYGDKIGSKDSSLNRSSSSSHRSFYYKSDNVRKGLVSSSSSSSRYERDRTMDSDREGPRSVRKRSDHDFDGFDRRKAFDRYRDSGDSRGYGGGGGDRMIHRSESFCGSRREYPKGFRSERDRSRREGSVSSWRRLGSGIKDFDESCRGSRGGLEDRGSRGGGLEDRGSVRSPKVLRDVKSPSWSKDSGSEQSRARSPPRATRDAKSKSKSPAWSKDSGSEQSKSEQSKSEQSKSVELKKTEELPVDSGSSSEMEEGELEPEPKPPAGPESNPKVEPRSDDMGHIHLETDHKEVQSENNTDIGIEEKSESLNKKETEAIKDNDFKGQHAVKEDGKLRDVVNNPCDNVNGTSEDSETPADDSDKQEKCLKQNGEVKVEREKGTDLEKPTLCLEGEHKQGKGIDLEAGEEDLKALDFPEETSKEHVGPGVYMETVADGMTDNQKNKGEGVSFTPSHVTDSAEDVHLVDRELQAVTTCHDNSMEGPSTRGFELFSRSPVKRVEKEDQSCLNKPKGEKLALEPLDLSLSLPNVLLPIGADATQAPGSPSEGQSVHSFTSTFHTNSDGFTASMSMSGSHSFYHSPSCSLTQHSVDYEQSVGSRPIFQGLDQHSQGAWLGQSQSQSDPKQKEVPLYKKFLMSGNGSVHKSQTSQVNSDSQAIQGQETRVLEGSSRVPNGFDRQFSFHKQFPGKLRRQDDIKSPPQSCGSHEIGSNNCMDKKLSMREKGCVTLYKSASMKEHEQSSMVGSDFVETIVARIVSEPVHVMAKKFHEMNGQLVACLKESIREMLSNPDKRGQLLAIQNVLQSRSDITMEVLSKAHRSQLEILVASKTGSSDFLQIDNSISSPELAEIFCNLRCRNVNCRNLIDDCDCNICVQKKGFCSNCMCLVCSKFDTESNTCSWVGCDLCLHWCHTDCGLRESFIRNGHSTNASHGSTEMQFHCVACNHPSEMFGFVKEVFQNFAKGWSVQTFCKELEYVKRIFVASKDSRGRRLHDIADQMLQRLANKSNLSGVFSHMMAFLTEGDSKLDVMSSGKREIAESKGIAGPSQETPWLKPVLLERAPLLEKPANLLPSFGYDSNDKRSIEQELQTSIQKESCFDELESIVKIKQAEAKMFQARADDARREAEGLKRIALAKDEEIEVEYRNRIAKLRLAETEEMRKQKLEELQALERAHLEYFNMKVKMESDIKDLLSKMEATKRSLAM